MGRRGLDYTYSPKTSSHCSSLPRPPSGGYRRQLPLWDACGDCSIGGTVQRAHTYTPHILAGRPEARSFGPRVRGCSCDSHCTKSDAKIVSLDVANTQLQYKPPVQPLSVTGYRPCQLPPEGGASRGDALSGSSRGLVNSPTLCYNRCDIGTERGILPCRKTPD